MYTLSTRFCTFGADLHAQSVLSNKISASELTRKFIKSALLVGTSIKKNILVCREKEIKDLVARKTLGSFFSPSFLLRDFFMCPTLKVLPYFFTWKKEI